MGFFEVSAGAKRRARIAQELPTEHPRVLDDLDTLIDEIPDAWVLCAEERAGSMAAIQRLINRLESCKHQLAEAADAACDSRLLGAGTTGTLIAAATTSNPAAGSAVVARSRALAVMPTMSEAFAQGRISGAHVQQIVTWSGRIDGFADLEQGIVALAEASEPAELGRILQILAEQCRPETLDEDLSAARSKRGVSLSQLPDGRWRLDGHLDRISGQALTEVLAQFTDAPAPGDDRSPRQRRADALIDMAHAAAANSRPLGVSGVTILVDIDQLPADVRARLEDGTPIGPDTWEQLACTPELAVLFGHRRPEGFVPLHLARTSRRANHHQWAALVARDRGCLRCGRATRFCHAHHIKHWADGGFTDLPNLALLCARCHTDLHRGHYSITVTDGKPSITPHLRT